eukprot:7804062-Alexandrium_andersonii.AAC.1
MAAALSRSASTAGRAGSARGSSRDPRQVIFRAQLDAADTPPLASGAGTPIPSEPPLLLSPTYDPSV